MNNNVLEREQVLAESILELEKINKQLAKLTVRKEELTETIIAALGHDHYGQKSYEYDVWKIECKTPSIYSLDKKAYESGSVFIPDGFDPVKSSVSYTVDKRLCDKYMSESPLEVREALGQLITVKPGKASVTIKARA
jgi:hypothetical protein